MKLSQEQKFLLEQILDLMGNAQESMTFNIYKDEIDVRTILNFEDYMKDLIKRFMDGVEK